VFADPLAAAVLLPPVAGECREHVAVAAPHDSHTQPLPLPVQPQDGRVPAHHAHPRRRESRAGADHARLAQHSLHRAEDGRGMS